MVNEIRPLSLDRIDNAADNAVIGLRPALLDAVFPLSGKRDDNFPTSRDGTVFPLKPHFFDANLQDLNLRSLDRNPFKYWLSHPSSRLNLLKTDCVWLKSRRVVGTGSAQRCLRRAVPDSLFRGQNGRISRWRNNGPDNTNNGAAFEIRTTSSPACDRYTVNL
jgi:hypothetical protein